MIIPLFEKLEQLYLATYRCALLKNFAAATRRHHSHSETDPIPCHTGF